MQERQEQTDDICREMGHKKAGQVYARIAAV